MESARRYPNLSHDSFAYRNREKNIEEHGAAWNFYSYAGYLSLLLSIVLVISSIASNDFVAGEQHVYDSLHGVRRDLQEHWGLITYRGYLSAGKHHTDPEDITMQLDYVRELWMTRHFLESRVDVSYIDTAVNAGKYCMMFALMGLIFSTIPIFMVMMPDKACGVYGSDSFSKVEAFFTFSAAISLNCAWFIYVVMNPRSHATDHDGFYRYHFSYGLWLLTASAVFSITASFCFRRVYQMISVVRERQNFKVSEKEALLTAAMSGSKGFSPYVGPAGDLVIAVNDDISFIKKQMEYANAENEKLVMKKENEKQSGEENVKDECNDVVLAVQDEENLDMTIAINDSDIDERFEIPIEYADDDSRQPGQPLTVESGPGL